MASFRTIRCICCSLLVWSTQLLSAQTSVRADPSSIESNAITLSVRTIQATEPTSSDATTPATARRIRLDSEIRDLESKLAQLPFDTFHLIAAKQEAITLKARDSLQLPNGQVLVFRPLYLDEKKVGLWLNWREQDGSEILNTRVHFDASDSVLTGTDYDHDKGLILAIKASSGPR